MVDFYRDSLQGQMRPKERKAMYHAILEAKPQNMLEIGTWKGGGSTYIISSAAKEYGGILHTIEVNEKYYNFARRLYDNALSELRDYVNFYYGNSIEIIPDIIRNIFTFDFVLFDGKEDADQTLMEYDLVRDHLSDNVLIACHDWKISKMDKLRPILDESQNFKKTVEMLDTDTGFAMFRKVKP